MEKINIFLYKKPEPSKYPKSKSHKSLLMRYYRTVLSESQNHKCCYCSVITTEYYPNKNTATVEHVIPKCHGGSDDLDNLVMACARCNNVRGSYIERGLNPDTIPSWSQSAPNSTKKTNYRPPVDPLDDQNIRHSIKLVVESAKTSPTNPYEINSKEWHQFNKCVEFFKHTSNNSWFNKSNCNILILRNNLLLLTKK